MPSCFTPWTPMRSCLLTLFISILVPTQLQAQQISWSEQQTIGVLDSQALRPRMTISAQGPVVVWGDPPSTLYVSTDTGTGFAAPVIVQPAGVQPWATSWAGADIAAHGDTLIVVYSTGAQGVGTLYASQSTDGGETWPDTARIAPLPGLEARFPTVAYIPGQGPVVQYMEFDPGWQLPRYVVSRSTDGGTTYGPPVQVSAPYAPGEVCDCCTGQAITGDGAVVALYRNNNNNLRTTWAATSTDGGATFPVGAEIDQTGWMFNSCASSGPDGYIVGDSMRYVWMSGATNGTKCYYGSAALTDLNVGSNAPIHGGQVQNLTQNFPRIAGRGDTLGIVWEQNLQGNKEILFRWSVNGWAGLSTPDTANVILTGAQSTPDIAFQNGTFHLVWENLATGQLSYRSAVITTETSVPVLTGEPGSLVLFPSPATEVLHISLPQKAAALLVYDQSGKIVLRDKASATIRIEHLSKGTYSVQCFSNDGALLGVGRFLR